MLGLVAGNTAFSSEAPGLRLAPFPKKVQIQPGAFALGGKLAFEAPAASAELLGQMLGDEMKRAGLPAPEIRSLAGDEMFFRLAAAGDAAKLPDLPADATAESYVLVVTPGRVIGRGAGTAGLFHAAATLRQLIRANRRDGGLPCMTISDWPSMRWRCFQDDMTRGPSSKLDTLKLHVDLGAELKMNLFTYYMEYQFAFKKHPDIGPKDGSLTPEDLAALVAHAKPRQMDILGNQQSFGHFERILAHPQYADCRESARVLTPVREETYKLLDEMYSEELPLLPFPWLNVCCDETWDLGTGPSKELAKEIGVGGVYVRHIRRVHDLLKDKYNKRMMMWGDIILKHPDKLDQVPKDTIMLTWDYSPRASFEDQIVPFARSGYEFFVCPGISNWSRILPDFGVTTANIRHFVRDGAKHGALGMLNTEWEDDGENVQGYKWHGYAWGAECAWNASTTAPEDFNRRIGAVLFGEKGDHFGQAIELLLQTHRLPGMDGMNNKRFWKDDFLPAADPAAVRDQAEKLLAVVRPAIEHLAACKADATVNAELLDSFLLGARRMELIGQRMLDGIEVARLQSAAQQATDAAEAVTLLATAEQLVRKNRDAHEALGREFSRIWLSECKPYALDWTMARYAAAVKRYDELAGKIAATRGNVEAQRRKAAGDGQPEELKPAA